MNNIIIVNINYIMNIMDIMNIMNTTAWMAMAGGVSALDVKLTWLISLN